MPSLGSPLSVPTGGGRWLWVGGALGPLCPATLLQGQGRPPGRPQTGSGAERESGHGRRTERTGPPPAPFKGHWTDSTVGCQAMQPHPCLLQPTAGNFTVRKRMQRGLWGPCTGRTQPAASRESLKCARRPPSGAQLTQGAAPQPLSSGLAPHAMGLQPWSDGS